MGQRQEISQQSDQCVYVLNKNTQSVIVLAVYVDDMIVLWKNEEMKSTLIEQLKDHFKMKDFGPVKSFLGMKSNYRFGQYITTDQSNYIKKMLQLTKKINL